MLHLRETPTGKTLRADVPSDVEVARLKIRRKWPSDLQEKKERRLRESLSVWWFLLYIVLTFEVEETRVIIND
jgi:hypothetical protein